MASTLPRFLPSFLPSSKFPSFRPSFLPLSFLPSFLTFLTFLPSFRPSFRPSFLPSVLKAAEVIYNEFKVVILALVSEGKSFRSTSNEHIKLFPNQVLKYPYRLNILSSEIPVPTEYFITVSY
jgi:hypothetical protein